MCHKYSFLLTRAGKILDGGGLTESHSEIASLHQVDEDKCNRYEWQPPEDWPTIATYDPNVEQSCVTSGLKTDREVFEIKSSANERIIHHIRQKFPTRESFESPTVVDEAWHEQTVKLGGNLVTVLCRGVHSLTDGRYIVSGGTIQDVYGGTIQRVYGGTIQRVYGGTIQRVYGGTIQRVYGGTIQDVSGGTIQRVSGGTIQRVSGGTIQGVSGGTIQGVYGGTIQDVSGGTIQDVSGGTIQRVSGGTIQGVSGGTIQGVSGGTIQGVSGGTIQDVSGGTIQRVSGGTIQGVSGGTIQIPEWSSWSPEDMKLSGKAVLIDRRGGELVVTSALDIKVVKLEPGQ